MIDTIIIQPPQVQLNTPYPSGAYLLSFFKSLYKKRGVNGGVAWWDLSNELFHAIFCREGISKIFVKTADRALRMADEFEKSGDENSSFQLRRYICQSELWCRWIDAIVNILCSSSKISGREAVHEFVRGAHVPRGNRVENYLAKLGREVQADDAQIVASLSLADLSDYIGTVYDKNFSLVRYAEHLAAGFSSFDSILENLDSPVLTDFLEPILCKKLNALCKTNGSESDQNKAPGKSTDREFLFCISVPFPGCLTPALFCARTVKNIFGNSAVVSIGGGYVNTELRSLSEKRFFDFADFVSFDKGYGSYSMLFDVAGQNRNSICAAKQKIHQGKNPLYKIRYRSCNGKIIPQAEKDLQYEDSEKQSLLETFPDFSSLDFSRYPRLSDDKNPMHRIWNDGAWLKAFMAYGCYWHRCSFCDTSLDYVKNYCKTNIQNLYTSLYEQSCRTGVYGIHFVDEACPPAALQEFALKNLQTSKKSQRLTFWGNIRFEKTFSRDFADILSCGGLTAVSGGIEIATGKGLDSVNKGTDMENIVCACAAFKEAGILVHSYMIFGFWNQSEQELVDSMETLRQLFSEGLIDSAFWHKFSLTRHSTVFREWRQGLHTDLKPVLRENSFSENELAFEGEGKSKKYAVPLNTALNLWQEGLGLEKSVEKFFPFAMPKPTIKKDYVQTLIQKYEEKKKNAFQKRPEPKEKFVWLGGKAILLDSKKAKQLCWSYMGEVLYADLEKNAADAVKDLLEKISVQNYSSTDSLFTAKEILKVLDEKTFTHLRGNGLCRL